MAIEGVDFSAARPPATCLRSAGKAFVCRYFGPGGSWKHATSAEIASYKAAGIAVVVGAEGYADDALRGYSEGAGHAREAHNHLVSVGVGSSTPIYFAVDFDMQDHQWPAVSSYLDGCASVIGRGRVGIYGGWRAVFTAAFNHKAAWGWQTYAWSGGKWSSAAQIQQYHNGVTVCGGDCDLDRAMVANYGQWPAGPTPPPNAPPAPAPVVTGSPWDYNDSLAKLSADWGAYSRTADSAARALDGMRT